MTDEDRQAVANYLSEFRRKRELYKIKKRQRSKPIPIAPNKWHRQDSVTRVYTIWMNGRKECWVQRGRSRIVPENFDCVKQFKSKDDRNARDQFNEFVTSNDFKFHPSAI